MTQPQSGQDIIRGSSNIPLSAEGHQQAHELGMKFVMKGGLDKLASSDLTRALQTTQAIQRYTHAPIIYVGDKLHPWHLGELEGQPTAKVLNRMQDYMVHHHSEPPQGRGPESTADGESFDSFKSRALSAFKMLLAEHTADPESKIGAVTHYRDIKLANAWVRAGGVGNDNVDTDFMLSKGGPPGSVWRLAINPRTAEPEIGEVNMDKPDPLKGGVYLIRHGLTDWNEENGK